MKQKELSEEVWEEYLKAYESLKHDERDDYIDALLLKHNPGDDFLNKKQYYRRRKKEVFLNAGSLKKNEHESCLKNGLDIQF